MSWGAIVVGVIGAGVSYVQSEKNRGLAAGMADEAKTAQAKAQKQLDEEKAAYKNMKIKNMYAGMENPYEDLTVNQQQAQFQAQQMGRQRANIMRGLRGAAGASGIASLAQSMANQGQLATQRISAGIGQQEARNQQLIAKGAAATDIAERGGEQWVQTAEMDRQATLLGMEYGEATGANIALQTAKTNEMNASLASQQITADMFGTVAQGLASSKTIGGEDSNIFTGNQNKAFEEWSGRAGGGTREQFSQWQTENPNWRKTLRQDGSTSGSGTFSLDYERRKLNR